MAVPFERPEVVLVVAAGLNGVIGRDNALPWHAPKDLKRFKQMTVGKPVVMGRKTFQSIGRPLPGRHNIVLTRDRDFHADGVSVAHNLAEAIAATGLDPRARAAELFVIGGAEIYRLAWPVATRIELTRVHLAPDGDALFPDIDMAEWMEVGREDVPADATSPGLSFLRYARR